MCVVRLHAKAGSENWIIGMAPASFSMEKIDDRSTTLRSFFSMEKIEIFFLISSYLTVPVRQQR